MTCAKAVPTSLRPGASGPEGDVWVSAVDLDGAVDDEPLSVAEWAWAEGLHERHRRRWVVSTATTRWVLGGFLGVEPGDLVIDRTCHQCGRPHGRARLGGSHAGALTWSMSRSAGQGVLAVSRARRVGIDIERLRQVRAVSGIARRFLPPSEAAAVEAAPVGSRSEVLLRLWTRKEAFLKATGLGLSGGLDRSPEGRSHPLHGGVSRRWWTGDVRVPDGFVASLVASR